jgi:serine protease Do
MKVKNIIIVSVLVNLLVVGGLALLFWIYVSVVHGDMPSYFASFANTNDNDRAEIIVAGESLFEEEARIVRVTEDASLAVVSVIVTKDVPIYERIFEDLGPWGDFFGFQAPQYREQGTERREAGGGSGFIVSDDGLVITNRHVVADQNAFYSILTNEGVSYEAEVVARDPVFDLAVLKIEGSGLPYLRFGNSDEVRVGQFAIAIGNALGEFRNTVSMGIISGLSRSIIARDVGGRSELLEEVIQTDAAINPGNSGGPLLNTRGEVIGINVATAIGLDNIGFALPSNIAQSILDSVKQHGEIVIPFLGIQYIQINEMIQELQGLPVSQGILVTTGSAGDAVISGSPAQNAGIQENDIILSVDGTDLTSRNSLASIIRRKEVGQTIDLEILRNEREITLSATLIRAPNL